MRRALRSRRGDGFLSADDDEVVSFLSILFFFPLQWRPCVRVCRVMKLFIDTIGPDRAEKSQQQQQQRQQQRRHRRQAALGSHRSAFCFVGLLPRLFDRSIFSLSLSLSLLKRRVGMDTL